jgi:hypothetical protein
MAHPRRAGVVVLAGEGADAELQLLQQFLGPSFIID